MRSPSAAAAFMAASLTAAAAFFVYSLSQNFMAASGAQSDESMPVRRIINDSKAFPACQTNRGRSVEYIYDRYNQEAPAYALLRPDPGTGEWRAYIAYTPLFRKLSPDELYFAAEHECAHQRLGHLEKRLRAGFSVSAMKRQELEADCMAVKELKYKSSYGNERIIRAMDFVISLPETDVHPSGYKRYLNAVQCLMDAS